MKKVRTKIKKDYGFMMTAAAILAGAVVLSVIISLFSSSGNSSSISGLDIKDLPEQSEPRVNELVINELMSSNNGVYANSESKITDYVELYNGTSKDINLYGYGLSDSTTEVKWAFPDVTIQAGQYLVVSCCGDETSGLNANFKLSASGGETVILVKSDSKVVDAVTTVSLSKNQVMARDENGAWYVANYGTPGFENSLTGQRAYFESLKADEESSDLVINEFLPRNAGNYINQYGTMDGFIEIKNVSSHSVKLSDYTLSNYATIPFRYQFDDVYLSAGETYVVYTCEQILNRESCTGFTLPAGSGTVVLGKAGKIVQAVEYSNLSNGIAYSRQDDGNYYESVAISPGYSNNAEGIEVFQKKYMTASKGLIINEAMNSNYKYLAQNGSNYYDWIELYNNSGSSINLAEYYLSTSANNLQKFQLPDVTLAAGEYYIVMCSGETVLTNKSYVHANFKLGDVESIYLTKGNKVEDSMLIAKVPNGYSYGRSKDGGYVYLATPTPGKENGDGNRFISYSPVVLMDGGVYDDVASVVVAVNHSGDLYYTTDGSDPTKNAHKYSGPITLTATTVLKFRNYDTGGTKSEIITDSYVINENHVMPVLSLSIDSSEFTDLNKHAWTVGLEKQCYIEFYEDGESFSIPCSISLFGGNARSYSKKSYCIRFKKEYGASSLHYPLFDKRDNSEYQSIVLRTGSTDWSLAMIRDILGTSMVDDYTDIAVQAYKNCVVYINGNYWGIYNIREKVSDSFISENYNVSEESVNISRIDGNVTAGSKAGINAIRSYCRTHDLSNNEYYEYVCSKINIINWVDYWISEGYVTNNDLLNVRYWNSTEYNDGKYEIIFYDLDYAWYNIDINWYTKYVTSSAGLGLTKGYENDIIKALFKNKQFRQLWLERLAYNLNNTWSKENLTNRLNEIVDYFNQNGEMARDRKRWKLSYATWEKELDKLRTWIDKRQYYYLRDTKSYFNLTDAQMKSYFGDLWK